jgi:hypothetical protein
MNYKSNRMSVLRIFQIEGVNNKSRQMNIYIFCPNWDRPVSQSAGEFYIESEDLGS